MEVFAIRLSPPSSFASQALFSAHYLAQPDDYHSLKSEMTLFEEVEMDAALALVPRVSVTKLFAVVSGSWSAAGNWYPNGVPGAGSIVCIPEGCTCTYNINAPLTELFTVRVDGTLTTDVTVDTAMLFDTMVVTPLGTFQDGSRATPVASDVVHQWIIATSNGLIDVSWDTFFQSRGIIWIGTTSIWGAPKTPFLEVSSHNGPSNTATRLTLVSAPTNWNVGDDIIICSTRAKPDNYISWDVFAQAHETERRTLTSSSGANLGWTGGLTYSHAGPQGTLNRTDCKAYVANLTRNIVFRPDDPDAPIHHRGHLMQMHNRRFQGNNFEVADLGRTAKHGGRANVVVQILGGLAADTATDLTLSEFWNGSAISFGPTFRLNFRFTAGGVGDITITGTNAAGGAQSETLAYASGFNEVLHSVKYFRTVTEIKYSTAIADANPLVMLLARSRQLNENGVRNLQTGSAVYTAVTAFDNIQGRYPLHLHKMGVEGDILTDPPTLKGCSIHGSPGWLVAQHQTHANIIDCVGFDAEGAGLVGEVGTETGLWQNNLMAKMIGNSDITIKQSREAIELDPAVNGTPFWFTGRLIRAQGCVAIDGLVGFGYNARLATSEPTATQLDQPSSTRGFEVTTVHNNIPPLQHFDDCVAIACHVGLVVVKDAPQQHHDIRTKLVHFKAWSVYNASEITYTRNYTWIDWDIFFGFVTKNGGNEFSVGCAVTGNASEQVFVRPRIEGFYYAFELNHNHTENTGGPAFNTDPRNGRKILDAYIIDCDNNYSDFDSDIDEVFTASELNDDPISLTVTTTPTEVTGTKHDEFGDYTYPFGYDQFTYTRTQLLTYYGYYTDRAGGNKYVMSDEWFSSALTGELQKIKVPVDVTSGVTLTGITNHGSMDLSNKTAPVMADFRVSVTRGVAKSINILDRATGNTLRFGGFQRPMKSLLINQGGANIIIVPLTDESYSESCYIWVDDVNGNTMRATMTIDVQ